MKPEAEKQLQLEIGKLLKASERALSVDTDPT